MVVSPLRNLLIVLALALSLAGMLTGAPVRAQDTGVPYWASLRGREANLRVGPGEDYRIAWRYHREHLPMKVLRVMEGWRLVQDPDGVRGWMLARFLKRERGAIVRAPEGAPAGWLAEMRAGSEPGAKLLWRLQPGVTGRLGDCVDGWCEFDAGGRQGFVRADAVWGAGQP
ncbi:hypothetical protein H7F50_06340 [Novosphingobium flavum]|uniref:SH3 domain-containing protein n=1 Tax=Novosphingobium aerophilum TaxID=2839843 RepID=UPI00163AFBB7|nr:SH3 domain-containing protein [Novosphingobium aerophilum]MBC2661368.1 hypothetical protein [Novosphingobium aerophilum]